jgi:hypothetical protein
MNNAAFIFYYKWFALTFFAVENKAKVMPIVFKYLNVYQKAI